MRHVLIILGRYKSDSNSTHTIVLCYSYSRIIPWCFDHNIHSYFDFPYFFPLTTFLSFSRFFSPGSPLAKVINYVLNTPVGKRVHSFYLIAKKKAGYVDEVNNRVKRRVKKAKKAVGTCIVFPIRLFYN